MLSISDRFISLYISWGIGFLLLLSFGSNAFSATWLFGVLSCNLLLIDTIKSVRGKLDLFDPSFLIGGFSIFFFLISPVAQLQWDFWPFLPSMQDDQIWIDSWALLNFIGVCIYIWSKNKPLKNKIATYNFTKSYIINNNKFKVILFLFLFICLVAQIKVYISFGGVSGFINTFTTRQEEGVSEVDPFEGLGLIMLVAESFKFILAIGVIYYAKRSGKWKSNRSFILLMLLLLFVFIFFGGLRGSRSSTMFPLFFAAGMYHFWIRKLTGKLILFGLIGVLAFSTSYYWYKIAGTQGIEAIFDSSLRSDFHSDRQDANQYLIVRDLGRMDFQSLALKRVYGEDYPLAFGRTYLVSIFSSIPKVIIPYSPDQITKEKTELIYGEGSYYSDGSRQTTLVLGQFGESLINFGFLGVLVFYFLMGRWVYWVRSYINNLSKDDARRFFLPTLSFIPLLFMITDMNVILYQLVRYLTLPFLMMLFCCDVQYKYSNRENNE